jgi:hypothetical protein
MNQQPLSFSTGEPNPLAASIAGDPGQPQDMPAPVGQRAQGGAGMGIAPGIHAQIMAKFPGVMDKIISGVTGTASYDAGVMQGQGSYAQPTAGLEYNDGNFSAYGSKTGGKYPSANVGLGYDNGSLGGFIDKSFAGGESATTAGLNYRNGNFNASIARTLGGYPSTNASIGYSKQF